MGSGRALPELTVERFDVRGVRVVALAGELDLSSVHELEAALVEAASGERPRVCLDLSELQFIDSSGVAAAIRAHAAIEEKGGALAVVCRGDGAVGRTLHTTGLHQILTVTDAREAAMDALDAPPAGA